MIFESLPSWSQWSIFGLSFSLNVFLLVQFIRGELVSRKQVDAIERVGQGYQKAWEISENTKQEGADVLKHLVASSDTALQILQALKDAYFGGSDVET